MVPSRALARLLLLASLLVVVPASPRASEEPTADRTLSPYFFVEGGDSGTDRLPLLGTNVRVEIAGVIAHVSVRQSYKNDGTRPIHARYVFPASTRAAVHGLTMTVDHEVVRARIRERGQARQEFKAAQAAGKNAALLEQQRPNVFTMELANVMPGQRIDVDLEYSELLVPTAGTYEFVYPTVVGGSLAARARRRRPGRRRVRVRLRSGSADPVTAVPAARGHRRRRPLGAALRECRGARDGARHGDAVRARRRSRTDRRR